MELKFLLLLVATITSNSNAQLQGDENLGKVEISLRQKLQLGNFYSVFVSFTEGTESVLARVSAGTVYDSRGARATAVYTALLENAQNSQRGTLKSLSVKYPFVNVTSFWITNQMHIREANVEIIQFLSSLEDVSSIFEEPIIYLDVEVISEGNDTITPNAEWGVEKIQAQAAWSLIGGNNGIGSIVGVLDSGVRRTHQALVNNHVGAYGWFDAYAQTAAPFDDHGHGTHVTGTAVGGLGYGVAPGAKWSACKALRSDNSGTGTALLSCGQFFACPTNPQGNNPDCTKAPHIVSNSWTATGEGGGITWFNPVISAWHAAGIIPVFANGNAGNPCYTGQSPADGNVIAVGSTTSVDGLSTFSSVGPSFYGEMKPDISAPGTSVRSAGISSDTATMVMSGTSMATPHVAGVLALLLSRDPQMTYTAAKAILQLTADKNTLISQGRSCNGVRDDQFPNYHFGHGRVNAFTALRSTINQ